MPILIISARNIIRGIPNALEPFLMSIWVSFFIIIPVVTFPLIVPGIGTFIVSIQCVFYEVVVIKFIAAARIMDVYAQVVFCDDVIIDGVKVAGITNDYTIIMVSDSVIKNYHACKKCNQVNELKFEIDDLFNLKSI